MVSLRLTCMLFDNFYHCVYYFLFTDSLIGVRHSASSAILRRKDFDPIVKHKYAFTIFTKNK